MVMPATVASGSFWQLERRLARLDAERSEAAGRSSRSSRTSLAKNPTRWCSARDELADPLSHGGDECVRGATGQQLLALLLHGADVIGEDLSDCAVTKNVGIHHPALSGK